VNFAQYADRVTMLVRGADLGVTMSSYLVEQIARRPTSTCGSGRA
jgi:hypothetical protein